MRPGNHRMATVDDIHACYRLLLDREADEEGLASWVKYVNEFSVSPSELAYCFLQTPEFALRWDHPLTRPAAAEMTGWRIFSREDLIEHKGKSVPGLARKILDRLDRAQSALASRFSGNRDLKRVEKDGFSLLFPAGDITWRALIETGEYESWVRSQVVERLSAGGVFLDVGCNIGYFSMIASRRVGPEGQVLAVDAAPENCRICWLNCQLNQARNVRIFPVAVSDALSTLVYSRDPEATNFQMHDAAEENLDALNAQLTIALPLDLLLGDLKRLDLVKMDIEGFEYKCLLGAEGLLRKHKPAILFEYSPILIRKYSGVEGVVYLKKFVSLGYGLEVLLPEGPLAMGDDVEGVHSLWQRHHKSGITHIDILAV